MAARSGDSKARVLDAAATIVAREGAAHLTIDGVAAHAGLSKGGVLYHFPSKRALLEGMLARLIDESLARSRRFRESNATALAAWIQAGPGQSAQERAAALAILANAAEDPSLLDPVRRMFEEIFEEIEAESKDPSYGLILLLAAEGLRFLDMLDLLPGDREAYEALSRRLLALAAEAPGQ